MRNCSLLSAAEGPVRRAPKPGDVFSDTRLRHGRAHGGGVTSAPQEAEAERCSVPATWRLDSPHDAPANGVAGSALSAEASRAASGADRGVPAASADEHGEHGDSTHRSRGVADPACPEPCGVRGELGSISRCVGDRGDHSFSMKSVSSSSVQSMAQLRPHRCMQL